MSRSSLVIVLALSAVFGTLFAVYPQLDLELAGFFVRSDFRADLTFGLRTSPILWFMRDAAIWVSALLVAPAVAAIAWKLARPQFRMTMPARAAIFLVATLALGPGLLTNVLLKPHWGRSRPVDVTAFGGTEHFVAWWDPRGDCLRNCSFVSGDVSGAFWTIAVAAVAPPAWRPAAYAAALTFGAAVSLMRMAAGAHFPSDVFFAASLTFLVVWLMYSLIYRWPSTRTTDQAVERILEQISLRRSPDETERRLRLFSRARAWARHQWREANLAAPAATIFTVMIVLATVATYWNYVSLARSIMHAAFAFALITVAALVFYLITLLRTYNKA